MILLASSLFLQHDRKQRERMKPYSPLATLLIARSPRTRDTTFPLFDATLAGGVEAFEAMLASTQPLVVGAAWQSTDRTRRIIRTCISMRARMRAFG